MQSNPCHPHYPSCEGTYHFGSVAQSIDCTSILQCYLAPSFLSAHTSWAPCSIKVPDKSRVTQLFDVLNLSVLILSHNYLLRTHYVSRDPDDSLFIGHCFLKATHVLPLLIVSFITHSSLDFCHDKASMFNLYQSVSFLQLTELSVTELVQEQGYWFANNYY